MNRNKPSSLLLLLLLRLLSDEVKPSQQQISDLMSGDWSRYLLLPFIPRLRTSSSLSSRKNTIHFVDKRFDRKSRQLIESLIVRINRISFEGRGSNLVPAKRFSALRTQIIVTVEPFYLWTFLKWEREKEMWLHSSWDRPPTYQKEFKKFWSGLTWPCSFRMMKPMCLEINNTKITNQLKRDGSLVPSQVWVSCCGFKLGFFTKHFGRIKGFSGSVVFCRCYFASVSTETKSSSLLFSKIFLSHFFQVRLIFKFTIFTKKVFFPFLSRSLCRRCHIATVVVSAIDNT